MKRGVWIAFLFLSHTAGAQVQNRNFSSVDWNVLSITAPTPDSLAKKLTQDYTHESDKVRAIFRWIAENISYKIIPRYTARYHYTKNWDDSTMEWGDGETMMARMVLQKRTAFCEGYAALFKALCSYAGIEAKVVKGYARVNTNRFYTNHSWNAVRIDSTWHLLDVTWASGYITMPREEFIKSFDERFFLPAPGEMIKTHYPEDIRWTLLKSIPEIMEFNRSPFRYTNFIKYSISSYLPAKGKLEAGIGDTLHFELKLTNPKRDQSISEDPFFDSTILSLPSAAFIKPVLIENGKAIYQFIIQRSEVEWLHLIYNDDIVLRYRIQVEASREKELSYLKNK
jgi:hypothetical protein